MIPASSRAANAFNPHAWFGISAVFHYLGPSFAVLFFPVVGVLGVAWFRIAADALVFAPISKPWRTILDADPGTRLLLIGLCVCLAVMNMSFYLALDKLPMSMVPAMEFVGTIGVALYGLRSGRNMLALILAVIGVFVLIDIKWESEPLGLMWATLNALLFVIYIILGHKASKSGASGGVKHLGASMAIAFIILVSTGPMQALHAFGRPLLVLAGAGVGVCSSVIPYVCDQLAMSRLPRASFALLLTLLPASATIIAAIVLAQTPIVKDLTGIALS